MTKFQELNKLNKAHRFLLNEEKKKINVMLDEQKNIRWSNNSKSYKNKYKNIQNLHNIIKSSVRKSYKNIYFYKNLLKVAENRKNDLSLFQINVIIKSLIQANIYNYTFFDSLKNKILEHAKSLQALIDCRGIERKGANERIYRICCSEQNIYEKIDPTIFFINKQICKNLVLNVDNEHFHFFVSDRLNILYEILYSYNYVNLICPSFYSFLFFILTKNYLYLKDKKNIVNLWLIYLNRVIINEVIFSYLLPKQETPLFLEHNGNILIKKKGFKLYRHKYQYNLKLKTIYDHTAAFKKRKLIRNKFSHNTKGLRHVFDSLFCKNTFFSTYKYIVLLLLKNEKYAKYRLRNASKDKNVYISNGYMYKLKNVNNILGNLPVKYFIKLDYVSNFVYLKNTYFPNELKNNIVLLQKLIEAFSQMNIRSLLLNLLTCQMKKKVDIYNGDYSYLRKKIEEY